MFVYYHIYYHIALFNPYILEYHANHYVIYVMFGVKREHLSLSLFNSIYASLSRSFSYVSIRVDKCRSSIYVSIFCVSVFLQRFIC